MRMPRSPLDDVATSSSGTRSHPRLRRESSADQVAAYVRQSILAGELRKGDRLRQDEIAEELGVSRIPIREAIIALDREGWVRFEANRGAFVTGLGADDIRDHYELRGLVLGLVARRAAKAATDDELADLATRYRAMQRAADAATFSALNERLLAKLLELADSPRLRAALLVSPSILPTGFFDVVPAGREIQAKGIGRLVPLLKARRPDDAERVMRATLRLHGDAVVHAFDESGLLRELGARPSDAPEGVGQTSGTTPRSSDTSAEAVARYVRKLIFDGRLDAGQRLPQDEIALAAGVSRIPVREAIISLQREGWLRVENHRGAFILPLDERAITDRFALYGRFHGFAARRAIERMQPGDLEALDALARDVDRVSRASAMERSNTGYHATLVSVAASNRLRAVLRSMLPIVPGSFFATVPNSIPVAKRGIATVHTAIVAGDADAAEKAFIDAQDRQAKGVIAMRRRRHRRS